MEAQSAVEPQSDPDVLAEVARLSAVLRGADPAGSEGEALDRIRALEELMSTIFAAQAAEATAFEALRRDRDRLNGLPEAKCAIRAGDEIGLAKKVSPGSGTRFLATARAVVTEMPVTYSALSSGEISADKARIMVEETATLSAADRRRVETRMKGSMGQSGPRSLRAEVRALVMQVDAEAAAERAARAAENRRVTLTPLDDGMGRVSAILPLPQAVAVVEGLRSAADSVIAEGRADSRRHPQIMADTFVERVTGQDGAAAVPTEVHLVVDAESLFSDSSVPAWLPGYGPLPATRARSFIAANEAEVFIRRMFTEPRSGQLVATEAKGRAFTGQLRKMLVFRDDRCRTPWCDAPIKHADHARAYAAGGSTSWENGSGLCAHCNYAKEQPGWNHEAKADRLTVTTPSGRAYTTTTPPLIRRLKLPRAPVDGDESDWLRSFAWLLEEDPPHPPARRPLPRDTQPAETAEPAKRIGIQFGIRDAGAASASSSRQSARSLRRLSNSLSVVEAELASQMLAQSQ